MTQKQKDDFYDDYLKEPFLMAHQFLHDKPSHLRYSYYIALDRYTDWVLDRYTDWVLDIHDEPTVI